jgi:hypothetical protein
MLSLLSLGIEFLNTTPAPEDDAGSSDNWRRFRDRFFNVFGVTAP